ncbi:hypothetical protein CBD41_09180 [bacterium TMED181]|nr:hypothetical protein [Planctomycetota bacterium]OUW42336.1 MAG: hypothetical protein CBD41_09180 [bacterium TMED181]
MQSWMKTAENRKGPFSAVHSSVVCIRIFKAGVGFQVEVLRIQWRGQREILMLETVHEERKFQSLCYPLIRFQ